jgi:cell division protease FtsH
VDDEVSRIVAEAHDRARKILDERREQLDALSQLLRKIEVIEGAQLREYVEGGKPIPDPDEVPEDSAQTEELSGPPITASPAE